MAEILQTSASAGWTLAAVLLLTMAMHERDRVVQGARVLLHQPVTTQLPSEYQPKVAQFLHSQTLPVVAEGADILVVMDHYDPFLRDRLVLLTSHSLAEKEPHSMTNELNMEIFGQDLGLPLQDYGSFMAAHKDFLLLVDPTQIGLDWIMKSLIAARLSGQDVSVQLIWGADPEDANQVYRVHLGAGGNAAR